MPLTPPSSASLMVCLKISFSLFFDSTIQGMHFVCRFQKSGGSCANLCVCVCPNTQWSILPNLFWLLSIFTIRFGPFTLFSFILLRSIWFICLLSFSLSLFPTLCLYKKIIYANGSFTTKNRAEHQKSLVKNNVKKQCSQPQTHARTHARAHPMGSYTNEYFDWSFQFLCSRSYHQ